MHDKPNEAEPIHAVALLVKSSPTRRFTLAPFLIPDLADKQGDIISKDEIFDAVAEIKLAKSLLDVEHLHVDGDVGQPVQLYTLPADTLFVKSDKPSEKLQKKLDELAALQKSIAKDFAADVTLLPEGCGMLGTIWSEAVWKKIQKGELTGLSIEGKGKRTAATE